MKKISTVAIATLTAATIAHAPAASARSSETPSSADYAPETTVTAQTNDESEPTLSFYSGAMGNMFKCGGAIAKIWCRTN